MVPRVHQVGSRLRDMLLKPTPQPIPGVVAGGPRALHRPYYFGRMPTLPSASRPALALVLFLRGVVMIVVTVTWPTLDEGALQFVVGRKQSRQRLRYVTKARG